jgi:hypothetical protein
MNNITLVKTEFCAKCQSAQNIRGTLTKREENNPDYEKKTEEFEEKK